MAERVWERFLTEQDKATLVGKPERRVGFGERPALLLIDLYRWVFGDKPEPVTEAIKSYTRAFPPGIPGVPSSEGVRSILENELRIPLKPDKSLAAENFFDLR